MEKPIHTRSIRGRTVRFFVPRPSDAVLKQHRAGTFADEPMLELALGALSPGAHILEVGSGVGNATLFLALFANPARIVPIEPNEQASAILRENVEMNSVACVDFSYLGKALGSRPRQAFLELRYQTNLGSGYLREGPGPIEVVTGDSLLNSQYFDLVIIDLPGEAGEILEGLEALVCRCRPALLVIVRRHREAAVTEFLRRRGFAVAGSASRNPSLVAMLYKAEQREIVDSASPPPNHIRGTVSRFSLDGEEFCFFIKNRFDTIQAEHFAGRLYEAEELLLMQSVIVPGACVLDCGANVGNHTAYFEKTCKAGTVVALEPNPEAIALLRINCALNGLERTDLSLLGIALGESDSSAVMRVLNPDNMGGAQVVSAAEGPVRVRRGDDVLAEYRFGFLKIDAEAMELAVLRGLADTIARDRPAIFVEVDDHNTEAFGEWCRHAGYVVRSRYRRHLRCENYMVIAISQATD